MISHVVRSFFGKTELRSPDLASPGTVSACGRPMYRLLT
jgi:hypothetical protein